MAKKQKDGRYRTKITIGYTNDGEPLYRYISGKTKRELESARQEAIAHFINGQQQVRDQLFDEYVVHWFNAYKRPKLATSTLNDYASVINNYFIPAFTGRMLRAIRPMELQQWLDTFAGKSNTRITLALTIIRGVFGRAYKEGILDRDPSTHLEKPSAAVPQKKRAFTTNERNKIESLFTTHEDGLLLALLYYLGVRRGEALALCWEDFDWKENVVHITKDVDFLINRKDDANAIGTVKTASSIRDVVIPAQLRDLLYPLRSLPSVYLLRDENGHTLNKSTYENKWISLMLPLGFVETRENKKKYPDLRMRYKATITPHYFRHNYITMLYEAGVDPLIAMRLVGHADYRTTANIYTHLNHEHEKKAKEKLDKVFENKKVAKKLPEADYENN